MSVFFSIFFCAIVVEGIVAYSGMLIKEGKICWQCVVAILIGVVVAVGFGLDLFALLGITSRIPLFGSALTGVVISRGSNYIFDLLKRMNISTELKKLDVGAATDAKQNSNT